MLELYQKYNADKEYTSIGLFRAIKETYGEGKVVYPGCYVHITPSLVFSDVTYVDSYKNTYKFYESDDVRGFVDQHKEYEQDAHYIFYQQDYHTTLPVEHCIYDIVISQYGGFVGQAVKSYLKKGGLLVCNNSHGDATMAGLDVDYELIAVYNRRTDEKFSLSEKDLETYMIPKKIILDMKAYVTKTMKGIGYTKSPSGYVFRKR